MRFDALSRLITYLLVGTSFLVLGLSGELGPEFNLFFGPAYLLSIPLSRRPWARGTGLWNAIILVGLVAAIGLAVMMGDWLRWAIFFASLLVTAKLFQQRTSADLSQLYLLSFLQLIAGAVVNPTLAFAIAFLLYVVLLTWSLVLLHLRRDLENVAAREVGGSLDALMASPRLRRLVTPGFLGGTSLLALGIFFASITVFLFFPRLGFGLFGAHRQSGQSVSGFNDQIQLGGFGMIKNDQTIVMRVESDAGIEGLLPLRLKGIAFDSYDGTTWSKLSTRENRPLMRTMEGGFFAVRRREEDDPPDSQRYQLRVFMEPIQIDKKTVFGEHRMIGVRDMQDDRFQLDPRRRTSYFVDGTGDVLYQSSTSDPPRYIVQSLRVPRNAAALRAAPRAEDERSKRYLQLPDDLDPRIPQLARTIVGEETNAFDQAGAIERYLLANYTYSLAGGQDPTDPLSDFLFDSRAGHCEFFSTAFVILARTLGIPARSTAGFYGGVYNSIGDYAAIRQADAHSWAEAFFPGVGWEVYDATPPSGSLVAEDDGWWARIGRYFDSLELLWYKFVIRFDLNSQIEFFKDLGQRFKGLTSILPTSRDFRRWRRSLKDAAVPITVALIAGVAGGFGAWYWLHRRRKATIGVVRRASSADQKQARKLYERLLTAVRRRGLTITPAMTPTRVLSALRSSSPAGAAEVEPVVSAYEAVVFGGFALDRARVVELKERIDRFARVSAG